MQNGTVHVVLAVTFAASMIALTALEVTHIAINDIELLWIVFQNVGLGLANSYYVSKIQISPQGLTQSTGQQGAAAA